MPRKYKFNQQYMRGGSQCRGNLVVNNTCPQSVDVSQYKTPCKSLPLDSSFNQAGGEYKYIVNPKTGRRVSIYGKIGKKVIANYFNYIVL